MQPSEAHKGWLQLLRFTTAYEGMCSCGWRSGINDKGRARRAFALHLTSTGLDVD